MKFDQDTNKNNGLCRGGRLGLGMSDDDLDALLAEVEEVDAAATSLRRGGR